jgi:hypothetical protein
MEPEQPGESVGVVGVARFKGGGDRDQYQDDASPEQEGAKAMVDRFGGFGQDLSMTTCLTTRIRTLVTSS